MVERFTDRARRVLVLAQEDARELEHNFIGTEHLLLGLVRDQDSATAQLLARRGLTHERILADVETIVGPGKTGRWTGSPPFTPRAKKTLELALREALQLGHNFIGPEHLLLALIREGDGVGYQVLAMVGDPGQLRQAVITELAGAGPAEESNIRYAVTDPPRCARCGSSLEGNVVYRVLAVPPAEDEVRTDPIDIAFAYCQRCGRTVTPASGPTPG